MHAFYCVATLPEYMQPLREEVEERRVHGVFRAIKEVDGVWVS